MSETKPKFQISLRMLLVVMVAFAIGFVARNFVDGLHPFYMGLTLSASDSPVSKGELLSIESATDPSLNRSVQVLSDETIKLPLIGVVELKGQTLSEVEQALNQKYKKYMATPAIQVFRGAQSL